MPHVFPNGNTMTSIYTELAIEEIPWNLEEPPRLLVELVQSGRVVAVLDVDPRAPPPTGTR